jgi:hypothetical protein
MGKYIDAEKLIAYLNKIMESYKSKMVDPTKFPIDHIDLMALLAREYQALIENVSSLQQEQPEVDLEIDAVSFCFDNGINISPRQATDIARHFYELGLNAKRFSQN